MRAGEVLLWSLLALAMAGLMLVRAGGPQGRGLSHDAYQYLGVAGNLRAGHGASTSIAHFDVERRHGVLPAPSTTFPPGFPAIIALLSSTGLPPEWAGVLASAAASVAVLWLLHLAASRLRLTPLAERVALGGWALGSQAALFGSTVHTEATFTALALAGVVLLLPGPGDGRERPVAASLALGLATWVRYAGLFLVVPLHVYGLVRMVRAPSRRRAWLVGLAAGDAVVGALLARNWLLTGTWRGGNARTTLRSLGQTARHLVLASGHLAFGSLERTPVFVALVGLALAGGLGVALAWARARRGRAVPVARRAGVRVLLLFGAAYVAAMAYAWATTDVSPGPRMLLPVLPLALLLVGTAVADLGDAAPGGRVGAWTAASLAALAVGFGGANLVSMWREPFRGPHLAVVAALSLPGADGRALAAWIEGNVPPDATLMATNGQPTGYVLRRRTVSLVAREYSDATWDEEGLRREARRFGVRYLIVYRDPASDPVLGESPFVAGLAEGRAPAWLEVAASSPGAWIYRVRPAE